MLHAVRPSPLSMMKWDAKFKVGSPYMPEILEDMLPVMRAFVGQYREYQNSYIIRLKSFLSGGAFPRALLSAYIAYAHELAAIPTTGGNAVVHATALQVKWTSRGCNGPACKTIAKNVFSIVIP